MVSSQNVYGFRLNPTSHGGFSDPLNFQYVLHQPLVHASHCCPFQVILQNQLSATQEHCKIRPSLITYSTHTEGHYTPQSFIVVLYRCVYSKNTWSGYSWLFEHISMAFNVSMGDHFTLQSQWCDSAQKGNHMRPLATTATAWSGLNGLLQKLQ